MGHKGLHLIVWINKLCLAFAELRGKTNLYDPLQTGLCLALRFCCKMQNNKKLLPSDWEAKQTVACYLFQKKTHGI